MKSKKIIACLTALLCCSTLSACGNDAEVAELRNIAALNAESELVNLNMSVTEKEAAIYAQVSNRTLLNLSSLAPVSDNDRSAVVAYMDSVDAQLTGTLKAEDGVIDKCYTDYLLMEFEKTPYYWQRSSMNIRGMDATSRSIVVDVTYRTIGFNKTVKPASTIVKGEPNYDTLLQVRFEKWLKVLDLLYGNASSFDEGAGEEAKKTFEEHYGKIEDILEAQRNLSLTDEVYENGNQKTYTGLVDHEQEGSTATMTVRYILVPNYTLGINQGYDCKHMYVLDYKLDNDMTEGRELYNEEDSAAVADSVYNMLYRYYKCLDEDNFIGLYSLVNNFKDFDKHFEDYFDTSYRKYDSFTLSIFNISGTRIECGTTVSRKVRAKGSNMSLPIYTDRYYYVIELVDGELKIMQEVLLSSTLAGEPVINSEEVNTTGFTSSISLTNTDKKAIEQLIADFGAQQLLADSSSDGFSALVDMSLSASQLNNIKENMLSIAGKTKATWVISYLQGQQNYASVKCRELVQDNSGAISEYLVTYDFIYKGGAWVVYDYQILSRAKLDTNELTTKNALCVVSAGSVDSLVSQVTATNENDESGENTDSSSDVIGEVIEYKEYTPVIKEKKPEDNKGEQNTTPTDANAGNNSDIPVIESPTEANDSGIIHIDM